METGSNIWVPSLRQNPRGSRPYPSPSYRAAECAEVILAAHAMELGSHYRLLVSNRILEGSATIGLEPGIQITPGLNQRFGDSQQPCAKLTSPEERTRLR
jgi:hypothetical protein